MRAMILAAGRGQRLRPLTDTCPKPLLKIRNKPLIEYHLEALSQAGVEEIVINVSYLGEQIRQALGTGKRWGVKIEYSIEDPALETGGGIFKALPLLGDEPFIVLSSDIWTDFSFEYLLTKTLPDSVLGHLFLVDNPDHNPKGDFGLEKGHLTDKRQYTYANIGLYRSELFRECAPGVFPLAPLLYKAIKEERLTGEHYSGFWSNIGTVDQLYQAQESTI